MKATYCEITNEDGTVQKKEIFKDPKTVVGMPKKSLRGLITVKEENGKFVAYDRVSEAEEAAEDNMLQTVFENGKLMREDSLDTIRKRRFQSTHLAICEDIIKEVAEKFPKEKVAITVGE